MKLYSTALMALVITMSGSAAIGAEARLETGDYVSYQNSLIQMRDQLGRQQFADLNWKLTILAYGDKPASMGDEEYVQSLTKFMLQNPDGWLERLRPYGGWTASQIMATEDSQPEAW